MMSSILPPVEALATSSSLDKSAVTIQPAAVVRRLGVLTDQRLSFDQRINEICKTCYRHIRAFRESLPDDVARTVACSIVTSCKHYCNTVLNSVLIGMSDANFVKLKRVQNRLARTVRLKQSDHITPALTELHWLPVHARVTFKVTSLTFKILQRRSPVYVFKLLQPYQPTRTLRTVNQNLPTINPARTAFAERSFRHSAPVTGNSLPPSCRNCLPKGQSVQTFNIKTHLFTVHFNDFYFLAKLMTASTIDTCYILRVFKFLNVNVKC
jgi:hypothetical protein